jgi:hypothetical protein
MRCGKLWRGLIIGEQFQTSFGPSPLFWLTQQPLLLAKTAHTAGTPPFTRPQYRQLTSWIRRADTLSR